MDPDEGSAASNNPFDTEAGLFAYFGAMRLAEASSSRQQQAPPPQLQQMYASRTSPLVRPASPQAVCPTTPHQMAYQLQMARQLWSPLPQQQRYPWDKSLSSGGYGSKIGAAAYNPQHSAASQPSVRTPCASASQYNPIAVSRAPEAQQPRTLSASASQYQPVAAFFPPVAPSPRVASSSTSQLYQPFGSPYQRGGDDSHLLSLLRGIQPGFSPWRAPSTMTRRARTMEEIRSELLRGPMELPVVLCPESSEHVVSLLKEGSEEIRLSVLAGVKSYVRKVMESKEGHKVFVALLQCCEGRLQELQDIVQAAVMPNGKASASSLLRSAKQDHGEISIKALITAVAQYPKLCQLITHCFVRERITDHPRGEQLLHHCFTTMPSEDSVILIWCVMTKIDSLLSSAFGSRCLAECFANATGDELRCLEQVLVEDFHDIARGQYSNYFVQRVLECGRTEIKEHIVKLLVEDAVSLSQHQYGSYVVEASFLKAGQLQAVCMHLMLLKFVQLGDDKLAELVQGGFSNFVVHKLLMSGKDLYPSETLALTRRIERLPPQTLDEIHAKQVVRVIRRLFPRHRRMY